VKEPKKGDGTVKQLTERQKSALTLILILTLIAIAVTVFSISTNYRTAYLRISYVDENGFAASMEDGTVIFFRFPDADRKFQALDTVRAVWRLSNESHESYTYPGTAPETHEVCDTLVKKVFSVRKAAPILGEKPCS
jgi:hypothetical protein